MTEIPEHLRKRAAEAEKLRCIPPESIDELRKAGLFRTLQPAVLGGYELPLDEAVLITSTVAEGCGSTGWVQGIYTDHCATLGMFDGRAQKDVWGASPDSLIQRKCGPAVANEAGEFAAAVLKSGLPGDAAYDESLAKFDHWLRADGHRRNPGTTADLIAAGLFVLLREGRLHWNEW